MKLTNGKRTAEITMQVWNGSGYGPDWSRDFFNAGNLPYDEAAEAYIVDDVQCCIDEATDWAAKRGDYADVPPWAEDEQRKIFVDEAPRYMVDVDKATYEQGAWVGSGDPHGTEYDDLAEAEAEFDRLVDYWQDQPDKPVIISLSEYEPEYDAWSGIKREVVR